MAISMFKLWKFTSKLMGKLTISIVLYGNFQQQTVKSPYLVGGLEHEALDFPFSWEQ